MYEGQVLHQTGSLVYHVVDFMDEYSTLCGHDMLSDNMGSGWVYTYASNLPNLTLCKECACELGSIADSGC